MNKKEADNFELSKRDMDGMRLIIYLLNFD